MEKKRHILLIEDDKNDMLFFAEAYKQTQIPSKCTWAQSGEQALSQLAYITPDIVFLDLEMPYKNGLECLVELRNNPLLNKLPAMVLSSTMRPANIQTAYEMGANLFLHKSSRYTEYANCLKQVMSMDWDNPELIREQYCTDMVFRAFN